MLRSSCQEWEGRGFAHLCVCSRSKAPPPTSKTLQWWPVPAWGWCSHVGWPKGSRCLSHDLTVVWRELSGKRNVTCHRYGLIDICCDDYYNIYCYCDNCCTRDPDLANWMMLPGTRAPGRGTQVLYKGPGGQCYFTEL